MDTFGAWLRQQRSQLKFPREQFAERIGCSVVLQDRATKHPSQIRAEQLRAELAARLIRRQIEETEARAHSQPFDQIIGEILRKGSEF